MGSPSLTIAFYLHIKQKRGHADVESLGLVNSRSNLKFKNFSFPFVLYFLTFYGDSNATYLNI